ncbi:MAG: hypothetical protein R3B44_09410 [Candidatus Brocadiaceae bacterium]
MVNYTENGVHHTYTSQIIRAILSKSEETTPGNILLAGKTRGFLG